jgi:hypothetical protein
MLEGRVQDCQTSHALEPDESGCCELPGIVAMVQPASGITASSGGIIVWPSDIAKIRHFE